MYTGTQPEHYGVTPPPLTWPEEMQAAWWDDFKFWSGEQWDALPLGWYDSQLGDA
jgi:hypothetical protein